MLGKIEGGRRRGQQRMMGLDYRIYTEPEKQSLGGHKQNLVHTRTQEKGVVTPQ